MSRASDPAQSVSRAESDCPILPIHCQHIRKPSGSNFDDLPIVIQNTEEK